MKKGRGEKELDDFESVFKALAHASRRHVLIVLNARGGSMTAGEIASRFSCTWPTTSRRMSRAPAPSAMRMPISIVRLLTEKASTPYMPTAARSTAASPRPEKIEAIIR